MKCLATKSRNQYNHGNSSFSRPQFTNNAPANRSQWQTKSSTSTSSPCSTTYCHFCNRPRHSTKDYRQLARFLRENDITPTANLTSLQPPNPASQPWLFDTGASHYVTSHFNNLQQPSACGGPDEIHLGDGSGLQITHTGTTSLTSASQKFHLDNILCVPSLHRNLLSVAKFCHLTKFSLNFFSISFFGEGSTRGGASFSRREST